MTMESPRSRTDHRKNVVAQFPFNAPRMPLQTCSVACGQGATITGTDQLLATSISQPHLVAPGAGLTILAPLIRSGGIGSGCTEARCWDGMPESVAQCEKALRPVAISPSWVLVKRHNQ